jgi:hypothetical protein
VLVEGEVGHQLFGAPNVVPFEGPGNQSSIGARRRESRRLATASWSGWASLFTTLPIYSTPGEDRLSSGTIPLFAN